MARPREHDRDKIASDLIEWAKLDDSINLNKFCALNELTPSKITDWARECNKFRGAYELAKTFIGYRREEKLTKNELHVKCYDLNASTYDYFLKQEKREQAEFESNLKKEEAKQASPEDSARLNALMDQLSSLRSSSAQAINSNNNDIKS